MNSIFTRRFFMFGLSVLFLGTGWLRSQETKPASAKAKFCRFTIEGRTAFGIVEGDRVQEISDAPYANWRKLDRTHRLADVKLLVPSVPTQVLALAGNYRSHLSGSQPPAKFRIPQPFFKSPSCLLAHEGSIVLPKDAGPTHFEAELVIVIGKTAKNVSKERALEHVLGVTCGNDISERYWQNDEENKDIQWWRAKGSDTFGPCGPFIASGLKYDDLKLSLRLNGQVKQEERTSYMIHDVASTVSFISQYITLHPGDLIFTGTPGTTSEIKPGDVVEVELEGVGVLRNSVVREK